MIGRKTIIVSVTILIGSILFRYRLVALFESWTSLLSQHENQIDGVFTAVQLEQYDGVKRDKLYLALMGLVYDVTEGKIHYSRGAPYHYFIGKDGSRAFITGDFQDESADKDHVLSLSCDELFNLVNWKNTLKEKYVSVGLLIGRFYDEKGMKTEYSIQFDDKIKQCSVEKEIAKKQETKLPPCNMEWTSGEGTRVWCTKTSGGVSRSWAGVPRLFYSPGGQDPRCVCVNPEEDNTSALLKPYLNCLDTSSSCYVQP